MRTETYTVAIALACNAVIIRPKKKWPVSIHTDLRRPGAPEQRHDDGLPGRKCAIMPKLLLNMWKRD